MMRVVADMRARMPSGGRTARRRRVFDMSLEMVLLLAALLVCVSVAAAQGDRRKPWAAAPMAATVTVAAPSRDLPRDVAAREIEVKQLGPLPFRQLAGLVADQAGVKAALQDRPGRVLDGDVDLEPAVPFGLSMRGTVPEVLDELARLSGYDWGWEDGQLVFYRYGDIEQRRPERMPGGVPVDVLAAIAGETAQMAAVAEETPAPTVAEGPQDVSPQTGERIDAEGKPEAGRLAAQVPEELEPGRRPVDTDAAAPLEGQEQAAPEGPVPAEPPAWEVIPGTHGTVEDVLRSWAERAGWQLAWKSERQFAVGAAAAFPAGETEAAGFLAAADALLAIGPMRRALTATAYPNRWLVVRDLGSAEQ